MWTSLACSLVHVNLEAVWLLIAAAQHSAISSPEGVRAVFQTLTISFVIQNNNWEIYVCAKVFCLFFTHAKMCFYACRDRCLVMWFLSLNFSKIQNKKQKQCMLKSVNWFTTLARGQQDEVNWLLTYLLPLWDWCMCSRVKNIDNY